MGVTADPNEQRVFIAQSDPAGKRVHLDPRLDRLVHPFVDPDLAFAAALAAHEQPEVPGVGARAAQILGAESPRFGGAQPTVA